MQSSNFQFPIFPGWLQVKAGSCLIAGASGNPPSGALFVFKGKTPEVRPYRASNPAALYAVNSANRGVFCFLSSENKTLAQEENEI